MTAAAARAEAPRRDAIVAGVDHSAESRGALRVAVELAERMTGRPTATNRRAESRSS